MTTWLENTNLRVGFSERTGAIVALRHSVSGWEVLGRRDQGLSFRLLMPLPGRRNNPVHGIDQAPPAVTSSGDTLTFAWSTVR
jgi:hypothetical protein